MLMSVDTLREQIILRVEEAGEPFLRILDAMTAAYEKEQKEEDNIIGYRFDGSPIRAKEAIEIYAKRVDAMKAGQKTSIEDLRKEAEQW